MWALHSKVEEDDCKLAGVGFKWMKSLRMIEKSCITRDKSVIFTRRSSYDIFIKNET